MDETLLLIVLVGLSLLLNIITLGMMFSLRKKLGRWTLEARHVSTSTEEAATAIEVGVVFCRNCGAQFDSTRPVCPHCETVR
jgi:hypothetical protein